MSPFDGRSSAEIEAPIDVVFSCLADLERVPAWQPAVREFICLSRDDEGYPVLARTVLETPLRRVTADLHILCSYPTTMTWSQARGDVKSFDGGWTLSDLGEDRTLAEYEVTIDLGRVGMFVRGPARIAGQAVLSSMPRRLKTFVEEL